MNMTHNKDFYLRWGAWLALLITSVASVCWRAFLPPVSDLSAFFEDSMAKYVTIVLILFAVALLSFDIIGFFRQILEKLHIANMWGAFACNALVYAALSLTYHLSNHPVAELYRNGSLIFTMFFFLAVGKLDFTQKWSLPLILLPLLGELYSVFLIRAGYSFGIYVIMVEAAYLLASASMTDKGLSGVGKKFYLVLGLPTILVLFCFVFLRNVEASKLTTEWLREWKNGSANYQTQYGGTLMFVVLTSLHLLCWFVVSIAARNSARNAFIVHFSMTADLLFVLMGIAAWYGIVPAPAILPIPFRTFSTARISFLVANAVFYRKPKPSAFWQELWKLVAEEEEKARVKKEQRSANCLAKKRKSKTEGNDSKAENGNNQQPF